MSHQDSIPVRRSLFTAIMLFVVSITFINTKPLVAQGVSQVEIVGIPPVITSPYLASLEKKFRSGAYHVQLLYSGSSGTPSGFRFRLQLSRNGQNLLNILSNTVNDLPNSYTFTSFFDEVPFPQSLDDILNGIDKKVKRQVLEGGTIPEGTYRLELRAIPQGGSGSVSVVPGIAIFQVRLPKPPILLSPQNQTVIRQAIPTFAWAPVTIGLSDPIEYHFRVVPIYKGQTPLQAINSNRPVADHLLTNQTVYSYTPDNLPLEAGKEYAWQVTAKDQVRDLPFTDDGRSEIGTFIIPETNKAVHPVLTLRNTRIIPLLPGKKQTIRFTASPANTFDRVYLTGISQQLKDGQSQDSVIKDWKRHFDERLKEAANNEGNGIQSFRQDIPDPASGSVKLDIPVEKNERMVIAWRLAGKRRGVDKPLYSNLIGMAATASRQRVMSYHTGRVIQAPPLNMTGLGSGMVVYAPALNMTGLGSGTVVQAPTLKMTGLGSGKVVQAPALNIIGLGSGKVVQAPTLNMTGAGNGRVIQAPTVNMTGLGNGKIIRTSTLNMTGMGSGKVIRTQRLHMAGMGSGTIIETPTVHMTGMGNKNQ